MKRPRPGRATLRDIARQADVAVSTVSSILNDHPSCYAGEPVRQRVQDVARELGYHPNLLYRGVRNLTTKTVGLIVPSLFVHQTAACIEDIEAAAWQAGYHLFNRLQPQRPNQGRRSAARLHQAAVSMA